MAAAEEIMPELQQLVARFGAERIAVIVGTSTSGIAETEAAFAQHQTDGAFPDNYHYRQQQMAAPAEFMAQWLGLKNLAYTVSTACSSSAKAFASANHLIQTGVCDAAIVAGVDTLCRLTLNGFNALESISPTICSPFSKNRRGITIGEAAAVFIVTPEPDAIQLMGVGESSDAHHMSAPDPEGHGAEAAMKGALMASGLAPADIDYINLHGTATVKNDQMEALAVHRLFGERTPCSSTKALTGHTLGAAGATEIGLCWLALAANNWQHRLPPHCWDGEVDEGLAAINLQLINSVYQPTAASYMMSNSFAFGGNNVSVIIGSAVAEN
ncbi:beta-ketoacyl-ACP synthase [Oceanicoccus sp. KOV_DT_Chl]|uniref:beta-ketoacyl-ACP synthase n=1 Tax=Oceanicoccus sp. KOV_DT_Chl TaxID=1904639 RepID=UPI001F20A83E|nr:beta-ketoacyl-ACP synthase [Oceanicoccus sp. KOV_DT_Chl]